MCVGLSLGKSTPRIRGMSVTPRSALALLVTRVAANHEKFPVPSHQLTVFTDSFNARTHLHATTPERPRPMPFSRKLPFYKIGRRAARGKNGKRRLGVHARFLGRRRAGRRKRFSVPRP